MAHAAAVASTADQPVAVSASALTVSALSAITIASPLVLPLSSRANEAQPPTVDVAGKTSGEAGLAFCELDWSLGTVSVQSSGAASPHVTCSVSCAAQHLASAPPSQPSTDQKLPLSDCRTMLSAAAHGQTSATAGNSMAQPVPSRQMVSDQTAYRCHPALADSALHLGAVTNSTVSGQDSGRQTRAASTRVPVAMHGYWIPGSSTDPELQLQGKTGRWAVTEAPAVHEDGSSCNDVWLLGRGAGAGGLQAKGLVGKVIGTAKARSGHNRCVSSSVRAQLRNTGWWLLSPGHEWPCSLAVRGCPRQRLRRSWLPLRSGSELATARPWLRCHLARWLCKGKATRTQHSDMDEALSCIHQHVTASTW